ARRKRSPRPQPKLRTTRGRTSPRVAANRTTSPPPRVDRLLRRSAAASTADLNYPSGAVTRPRWLPPFSLCPATAIQPSKATLPQCDDTRRGPGLELLPTCPAPETTRR